MKKKLTLNIILVIFFIVMNMNAYSKMDSGHSKPPFLPVIKMERIKPFLNKLEVTNKPDFPGMPFVIGSGEGRLAVSTGDRIYVGGFIDPMEKHYNIYRVNNPLLKKGSKKPLGYAADYIGNAVLVATTQPATMRVTYSTREVLKGDRLIPDKPPKIKGGYLVPKRPKNAIEAQIIYVSGGVTQIGQYQLVVIDKGKENDLKPGNALDVYHIEEDFAKDKGLIKERTNFQAPETYVGEIVLFKVYPKVSIGLVMKAKININKYDIVKG